VLLLAVAVIDDLGAILVIAAFYSDGIALSGLVVAALGFAGVLFMQRTGVRVKMAYVLPSLVAWAGIYAAGIHPTIAGVIVGLLTPVRAWLGKEGFLSSVQKEVDHLAKRPSDELSSHELAGSLRNVDEVRREAMSPASSLIETLHPWVAFGIMPLFALANAGVSVEGGALDASAWTVAIAVSVGLVIGKPIGVFVMSWLAMRAGIATLPSGLTLKHLAVLGVVAGIGFTMALFIAQLAFKDAALLSAAKLGILAASLAAGVAGLVLGRLTLQAPTAGLALAQSADEAEQSTEL
jgi:NhaA family Na+:H+ antiporter